MEQETRQRPVRANRGEKLKRYLEEEKEISSFQQKKHKLQEDNNLDSNDDVNGNQEPEKNTTTSTKSGEVDDELYNDNGEEEEEDDDDDEEGEEENKDKADEEVRCLPCGATTENYNEDEDTLGDMVQCDKCKTWQHAKCMGYKTKRSIPEVHNCDVCTGKPVTPIRPKTKPKKKNDDQEEAKKGNGISSLKDENRISTAKAFCNYFKKRFANRAEGELTALDKLSDEQRDEKANELAREIESLIFETYKGASYTSEGRRILFVLKKHFMNEIVEGTVTFKDVLHKTPQEINEDIAKIEQQNRENIKNIILRENDTSQIIRRTHKGDIIKENEFIQPNTIDESLAARKVDHRKFSDDILNPGHLISHTANESNSYQNLNPRIVDEDSESEHEREEGDENEDEITNKGNNRENSKSTDTLSDLELGKGNSNGKDEDDDDLLPFLSGGEDSLENILVEKIKVWTGRITFPEFATFNAVGEFYACTDESKRDKDTVIKVSKEILNLPEYVVQGKLDRNVADNYLNKVINSRDLFIVEISNNENVSDKQYLRLYEFLLHKNKVGVLGMRLKFVKDSYLMPIDFRDERLPNYLQPFKKDLRIGLYAVFVVQRNYIPISSSSRDSEYIPREHISSVPTYHPPPQYRQQQQQQQFQNLNQTNGSDNQGSTSNLEDILKLLS